jgi:hypothetical protein
MSGTEKLQPTIISKFEKPRCFRGVRHLPANYRHSKKAWMTTPLFIEFLRCLDAKMGCKGRKILLFIDHCPAHPPGIIKLRNVEVVYFPANSTSQLQPLDQGVIAALKRKYRKRLIRSLLWHLRTKGMDHVKEHGLPKWNVLDAMHHLVAAWNDVSQELFFSFKF